MSALDSFNLGDFLRIREEDENRRRVDSLAGLTLSDIILSEKRVAAAAQTQIGRTLLDVIGAPEPSSDVSTRQRDRDRNNQIEKERRTWKAIKDRLRLKRNGAVWNPPDVSPHRQSNSSSNRRPVTSTSGEPGSADVSNRTGSNRRPVTSTFGDSGSADVTTPPQSSRTGSNLRPATSIAGDSDGGVSLTRRGGPATMRLGDHMLMDPAEPVRMSLMELLEETTERQVGAMGSRYDVGADEEEAEEEGGLEAPATAPAEQKCCVCMIRHRGAAFIPCGHTFCRVCSRELFLQRGNCPLCNAQISEILDIF